MPSLLAYVRRAFELPPRQAARAARELAAMRTAAWRQRVASVLTADRVGHARFDRVIGSKPSAGPEAGGARLFAGRDAVLPVRWTAIGSAPELTSIRASAAAAIAHRFDLLGAGPVRVSYDVQAAGVDGHVYSMPLDANEADRQRRRMAALLPGITDQYDPIDWHIDFKSGFRWPPKQWFSGIEYGQHAGVDVKLPWELSRFQHVGSLGLAYRLGPNEPEGRRAPAEFCAQVIDWIAANPVGRGVNWVCPMDVALRAVNWLIGVALMQDALELSPSFRWLLAKSLHAHGRHIEANLEYHREKTGNHYLSDIVGLICIGAALPELPESNRWCVFGIQELTSEMERQVLPDGADIEGSLPYHHLVSELFLVGTLVALRLGPERRDQLRQVPPGELRHAFAPPWRPLAEQPFDLDRAELFPPSYLDRLLRMAEFAAAATKPDGRVPQTGDNDNGRVYRLSPVDDPSDRRTVLAAASRLFGSSDLHAPLSAFSLDADVLVADAPVNAVRAAVTRYRSGAQLLYVEPRRYAADDATLTLYEAGGLAIVRAGPLYLAITLATVPHKSTGGHFHNDLLGFELQWDGVDFVVDGGTYLYTPLPSLRDAFRATAAHSTIAVTGREQRLWPAGLGRLFSVQRDAAVRIIEAAADALCIEAVYADVRHVRTWRWGSGLLRVIDDLTATQPALLTLNVHPDVAVSLAHEHGSGRRDVVLDRDGRRVQIGLTGVRVPVLGDGCYSLGYGRRLPNTLLHAELISGRATADFVFTHGVQTRELTTKLVEGIAQ